MVLETKELPPKLNSCCLIDVSKEPNDQALFNSRITNLIPSHIDNFHAINNILIYEIPYPFVNCFDEVNWAKIDKKKLNQHALDDTLGNFNYSTKRKKISLPNTQFEFDLVISRLEIIEFRFSF